MPPMRLRMLLFILLTLGTLVLTAVLMFSYSSSIKKQELTALTQLGDAVSGSAALMIVDLIIEEDYARLDELCLGYAANPSILTAYVSDAQGKIVADSSTLMLGRQLSTFPPVQQTVIAPLLFVEQYKQSLLFTRTVVFEEEVFGFIFLNISKKKMLLHLRQEQRKSLMIGALFCCFGLVISWYFALLLIRPLEQMTAMAQGLSVGKVDLQVNPSAILEIEHLADTFQRMGKKITRREHALLASEKQYRDIFDNALEGIFQTTAEGRFTTVNPKMASLLGYSSPEEFLTVVGGLRNQFLINPQERRRLLHLLKKQGEVVQYELQLRGKDQQIIWGSLNIRTLYDQNGIFTGFEGLLEDITQQKESAEILADERERLGVTLRSIGDGVISTDREGLITLINRAAEEMTGWSADEAQGRPLEEVLRLINGVTGEPCLNPVEKAIRTGQIVEVASHTLLIARDGSRKNITDSGAPIRDKQSNIIGVVLVFRDVTELYNIEQEQLKLEKIQSLGTLAGGIAHDFNNILAAIVGSINLARHDQTLDEKTIKHLDAAQKASMRAKGLTTQLLTFAKGGAPIKKAASIEELVRESADFVLHGSNVSCTYLMADDLWMAEVDKGQISQVIQNLVINADHAMPVGGELTIHCANCSEEGIEDDRLKTYEHYVKITVTDTGEGIPANVLDKIFDPYYSTKQQGSGLGLSICHSIVSRHDGHITVQSMPGTGTSFSLYLPASGVQQSPSVKMEEEHAQGQSKARVMIMDDDEVIRNIAYEMLDLLGHEVILACDGEEAIALFEKNKEKGTPIDVIVMDLTIPGGMGGKEAVLKILDIDPVAQVIVSSGYSNDPVMANYRQYGFTAAISKPYLLQDFVKGIEKCLQVA